jgi:hypothetical protein
VLARAWRIGLLVMLGASLVAAVGDPSEPGAYCPFPKKGEKPVCFTEVEQEYSDFFAAVDSGQVDGPRVRELEETLKDTEQAEERALALSSLAYGYFMLAERAAASDRPDPALVARLETWNALLSSVYEEAESQPQFRTAVRDAALDLHARAPTVASSQEECGTGTDGPPCGTTSSLLAALRRIDDPDSETGVRGALGNLLERMLGEDEPVEPAN